MDFEKDLAINKNQLDQELMAQAQKMMRYSSAHAQAQYDRDRAKQSLDVIKAGLDSAIRADLTTAQVKFTEAVVDGKIKQNPSYLEAQEKFIKAEYQANLLLGGVMAMNARRGMLESLTKLFLSGYWSEPRLAQDGKAIREAGETKIRDDLNAALNRPEEIKSQEQQAAEAIASLPQPERGPGLVSPNSPPRPQPIVRRQPK